MKTKREEEQPINETALALSMEVMAENIPELDRKTLAAIRYTNHFFSNHNGLKTIYDSKPWCELAVGTKYTLLLTHDKKLYVSGNNDWGQLGEKNRFYGFTPCTISMLEKDEHLCQIETGLNHTLLLSNKGRLIGGGMNEIGQLGCESVYRQEAEFITITIAALEQDERIVSMQSGVSHTVLLTNKGRLLGSGDNDCGQLGLPEYHAYFGFEVCKVGALKDNERVIKVVAGLYQTLLLTSQNRLLVTGLNEDMILGISNEGGAPIDGREPFIPFFKEAPIMELEAEDSIIDMSISINEVFLLTKKGQLLGFTEKDGMFNKMAIAALQAGEMITKLKAATGSDNTFILTNKGRLLAIGSNNWGQLGFPKKKEHVVAFEACDLSFLAKDENIIEIVAGDCHTLLLTSKERVFGCGSNVYGQLGFTKIERVYGFKECDLRPIKNTTATEKEQTIQSPCFS